MMRTSTLRCVAVVALLLASCSVPTRQAAFDGVSTNVHQRLGDDVRLATDDGAGEIVARLLAQTELTADDAVRLAIANNPMLHAELLDLEVARTEIWQASLAANPVLDAELRVAQGGGDLLELGVAQSIVDVLLIPKRRQMAAARFAQVEARVTGAVVDLATEVRANYRALQADRQMVEVLTSATDASWLSADAARRLREAGNILELEELQQQALLEGARIDLAEVQSLVHRHRENLNVLFGLAGPAGDRWRVVGRLPHPAPLPIAAEDLERSVVASSLDLEARRREVELLGQSLGIERLSALFPVGELGAKGEREADEAWSVGGSVSVSIPVFDFGQAVSAEVRARVEQAVDRLTDTAIRVRRAARDTFVATGVTGNTARHLFGVVLPLRARITARTQEQFDAMQLGVFRLLDAKRAELDAARRYVATLERHWIVRSQLEALLLGRLPATRFGITGPDLGSVSAIAGAGGNAGH